MDVAAFKTALETKRSELVARLEHIEHDLDQPHTRDLEDQAVEIEGDEVLERLGSAGVKEIAVIDAALARVADGSYGVCARCGDEISAERLAAMPETPFCRACAH